MGTINFTFMGICTHFQPTASFPLLPAPHRIVLINASNPEGFNLPFEGGTVFIPPHFASMTIDGNNVMPLNGWQIQVANPAPQGISFPNNSFNTLPNLTALMDNQLAPPSAAVVLGSNPALTAAYFDFADGTFVACSNGGAAQTQVTVNTLDDPAMLILSPFPGTIWPQPEPVLIPASSVMVQNVSENETNSLDHFLLNYLTSIAFPANPQLANTDLMQPCSPALTAGPGCSNSDYP